MSVACGVHEALAPGVAEEERARAGLEERIASVAGVLNAAAGQLVALVGEALDTGAWKGSGIHTPAQYVAWKCGMSSRRARAVVSLAERRSELPTALAALAGGEISEDQAAVLARLLPPGYDAQGTELARATTVSQLRRALRAYRFPPPPPSPLGAENDDEAGEQPEVEGRRCTRRVSMSHTDDGAWKLSAVLPPDEGAVVEAALTERRDSLVRARHPRAGEHSSPTDVSWADALVSMAQRCLDACATERPDSDRHLVHLHIGLSRKGDIGGHLHLGPELPDGLRRFLSCDARIRPVWEVGSTPLSVGRASRTVPSRTRVVIENRDRGCRVPGCDRSRWLHVHHLRHWEDGGGTDTANLVAICAYHHRLHHRGRLGIEGDADDPDGLTFTDHRGRELTGSGSPAPPEAGLEAAAADLGMADANWRHPSGERWDMRWLQFTDPSPN